MFFAKVFGMLRRSPSAPRRLDTSRIDVKPRQGVAEISRRRPMCSERNARAGGARGGLSGLGLSPQAQIELQNDS
jgi:hypothetical protein